MTVTATPEDLVARYPELNPLHCENPGLLERVLAEASAFVDHSRGTESQVRAVILATAAQKVALSPCGRMAGFSDAKGVTNYDEDLRRMWKGIPAGPLVI